MEADDHAEESPPGDRRVLGLRASTCGERSWGTRSEQGFSLVEVLVAMVLSSLVVVALAAGLLTLVRVTSQTDQRQKLQLATGNYSESVKAMDYLPCGTHTQYDTAYLGWAARWVPPAGATAQVSEVRYWQKVTGTDGPGAYQTACPSLDEGSQLLTLSVTVNGRDRQVQIVKSQR